MAVPIIGTGTNTMKNASSTTNTSLDTLSSDFDSFLTLLTTQLKNQDPTSPMETNEFTQQIIGFSQVQQAINTNTNLEKMIEMNKNSTIANAVSYVDQFVVAETEEFNLKNGAAFLSYDLPQGSQSAVLTIKDSTGKIINSYEVTGTEGYHKATWDGKDKNNEPVADGKYTIQVVARDKDETPLDGVKTYSTELVTQVDLDGEETIMYFGDIKFDMDEIRSIVGYYAPADVPAEEETEGDETAETPPVEDDTTPPTDDPEA